MAILDDLPERSADLAESFAVLVHAMADVRRKVDDLSRQLATLDEELADLKAEQDGPGRALRPLGPGLSGPGGAW